MSGKAQHARKPHPRRTRTVWGVILLTAGVVLMAGTLLYLALTPASTPANGPLPAPDAAAPDGTAASTAASSAASSSSAAPSSAPAATAGTARSFAFTEETKAELDDLLAGYGEGVSVYFEDLESGYTYLYGADTRYFAASVMKAPYCLYLYDLVSQGKADLDAVYTYTAADTAGGTGVIQNMEVGSVFTLRELLHHLIVDSDNVALRILRRAFPADGFQAYAAALGLHRPEDVRHINDSYIHAADAGVYLRALYRFMEENPYGAELRELMMQTRNPMIRSGWPLARKYGWADKAFHDMGIVYAPHPYALAILSDREDGTAQDFAMFRTISAALERAALSA